ncbi:hypothetical protein SLEP1_g7902 [Rubroshorea leprosula]|uniref:Uncharacterized protein n=1 Tax=Rubroshorea leprosula TaxID=152421 RepID=A0AAV5I9U9_9ROSI|nr:hypothetical protein SLEP1_g7902 [Rubroshorea leprosula]
MAKTYILTSYKRWQIACCFGASTRKSKALKTSVEAIY